MRKGTIVLAVVVVVLLLIVVAAAASMGGNNSNNGGSSGQYSEMQITVNDTIDPWSGTIWTAADGKKFVGYDVTLKNQDDQAMDLNLMGFTLKTEKGLSYTPALPSFSASPPSSLAAGASYTTMLVFEVDPDDHGKQLAYDHSTFEGSANL